MIIAFALFVLYNHDFIIGQLTNIPEVRKMAKSTILLVVLNIVPELNKVMLKGAIRSLLLQRQGAIIGLLVCWGLNLLLIFVFCIMLETGMVGLWYSKIIFEVVLYLSFLACIYATDWEQKVTETRKI